MRSLAPPGTRQTIKSTTTTATTTTTHRNSIVSVVILVVAQSTRATYFTMTTVMICPTAMAILAFGSDFLCECLCMCIAHLLNVGQVQRLKVLDYHCPSCRHALKLDHVEVYFSPGCKLGELFRIVFHRLIAVEVILPLFVLALAGKQVHHRRCFGHGAASANVGAKQN